MSEDRLLKELGHLARREEEAERARLDERWDRLEAGTLTPEEEAELRALAESSVEAREAYEAFSPLGADFQARVIGAITPELPREPSRKPRSRLLPYRRDPGRLELWLGAAAAVAAVLLILVRWLLAPPPLPVYTVALSGGAQTYRGEPVPPSGPPLFVPGSLLTLDVRPEQPVEGPVEVRALAAPLAGAGEILPLPEDLVEVAGGNARFRGTLGREIQLRPGTWRIWIVAGRPGKIPKESALRDALRAGETRHAGWQAVSTDLRVEAQAPP